MTASDAQTSRLADILSARAETKQAVTYVVGREGIDIIKKPGSKSEDDFEIIWACPKNVIGNKGGMYKFRNSGEPNGAFKSDLMESPDLTAADDKLVYHLLNMNNREVSGKSAGWFSAAFLTQIIRKLFNKQFPFIQYAGQAGSGKSTTTEIYNSLHYFMEEPKSLMPKTTTMYSYKVYVGSSASQPVILEEMKKRAVDKQTYDHLLNIVKSNYNAHSMSSGAVTKETGLREMSLVNFNNGAPIVWCSEAPENQSAILERCVLVHMAKHTRVDLNEHLEYLQEHRTELGKLGKALAVSALSINLKDVRSGIMECTKEVRAAMAGTLEGMERPIFNHAVTLFGLRFLKSTLQSVFGSKFDKLVDELYSAILDNLNISIPKNLPEIGRVLDTMAQLTRNTDPQFQLVQGVDYTISGNNLDLKLRTAYAKYVRYQNSLRQEVLYDNEGAFITAMSNYQGTTRMACPDNPALYDSVKAVVYRLSISKMIEEGIDNFKD